MTLFFYDCKKIDKMGIINIKNLYIMDVRHISDLSKVSIITNEMVELVNELKNSFKRGFIALSDGAYAVSSHMFTVDAQTVSHFINDDKHFLVEVVIEGKQAIHVASASDTCFRVAGPNCSGDEAKVLKGDARDEMLVLTKDEFCVIYPTQAYKTSTTIPTTASSEVKKVTIYIPFKN